MKKTSLKKILFAASFCLFTGAFLFAQEKDNKKVHITVKKNDATTVDTSFTLDEDMDKDEIQKMIHELSGMDVKVHHGDKMGHVYAFSVKDSVDFDTDIDVDMKEMEIKVIVDDDGESFADMHKDDKGNVFIMKKEADDKSIIVLESSEKPIRFVTKDGKELEFIVKDKKSGTDIALNKVKVITIETSEDGVINIVVSDKK
ncbi:MAG: hypothetical protein J7K53_10255 [Bacteroidales bacterium]|nr:hypothetical protein [Bacteroidales bacterium]